MFWGIYSDFLKSDRKFGVSLRDLAKSVKPNKSHLLSSCQQVINNLYIFVFIDFTDHTNHNSS